MATTLDTDARDAGTAPAPGTVTGRVGRKLTSRSASLFAIVIALLWTLPTFGLFVSSVRPEDDINDNGWWNFFTSPRVTLQNYQEVLFSESSTSGQLAGYFVNSFVITVPAVVLSVGLASLCAYALACIDFRGRNLIFVGIFALQIVPLQMALIPLLQIFNSDIANSVGLNGFATVWVAHTIFGLPLAVFLFHNFMSELPKELFEAARVDGAGHARVFRSVVLPLIVPAIASLAIFQFLWIWNDLLVALVFVGGTPDVAPLTARLAELAGGRGENWQRLTAGAFVSIIVPLLVFFGLQRYFVRGLLAGGLKG